MIVTCVHVNVLPDRVAEFQEAITDNYRGTAAEPGNIRFDVLQQSDDPCRFMIYEVFESEEAVRLHKETPHYLKWRDTVREWMAEPRRGIRYDVVEPSEKSLW
ncbi:MAG: antibiotic biosynthesis monooxygenase [Bacteroidales bacterium]|jgi:autoinducer 2-degrading protein|nr:antibiotic biosynthesis monooxygenase [Bacteroidales bacterium]